ncbi:MULTISPECIES: WD40 repeat domain-containing protein [Streptomyces]|uniref:WD40 repeat domain-containing protein n=1 Tax=Streptomyces TaxID=1883 RepID=UPI001F0C04BF|nr:MULTISPECIES: WD40 repeat domain-containing protein [Streptomyces]
MTVVEAVARVRVSNGRPVEQLACHPRLPLVAGLDSERPAVHVWDCEAGQLHELGSVGAESTVYGDAVGWDRTKRTPAVTWHPDQPLLVVAGEGGVVQWTPAGLSELEGLPPTARYRSLAFSPDGQTLWASPSSGNEESAWGSSDVLDLASGTVSTGPPWDTGVAEHPAGGLVATLCSDQGATLGLFARVDHETAPAAMRVLRRALILDADGYETPIFSADGRHLAIRGNAYDNSLEVFEFPSLHRVLATTLGDPSPGYPYPQEWLEQMRAWSRHNIAFGAQPGVLWVGTPTGTLVEVDLETRHAVEHDVLAGCPVSGLGTTTTGELVIASGGGDLVLLSVRAGSAKTPTTDGDTSRAAVTAFLDATSEVPDDSDLETHLVVTDGARTWESDDLATVTTATATDPTWLQLQAAINNVRDQDK